MKGTALPSQTAFFDTLTRTNISDDDYIRALDAWQMMGCTNFGEYMMSKCEARVL